MLEMNKGSDPHCWPDAVSLMAHGVPGLISVRTGRTHCPARTTTEVRVTSLERLLLAKGRNFQQHGGLENLGPGVTLV